MRDAWRRIEPWTSWAALAFLVGVIFFLSSREVPDSPLLFPLWDKVAHLIEYGILGWLSQRAARLTWPGGIRGRTLPRMGLVLVCGICVAVLDEHFQAAVPGRVCSVWDLSVNTIGLVLGLILNSQGWRHRRNPETGGAQ